MRLTILMVFALIALAVFRFAPQDDVAPAAPQIVGGEAGTPRSGDAPAPTAIAQLESGLRLKVDALPALTNVVFISTPKVAAGDVTKVAKGITDALQTFRTVAVVHSEPDPTQAGRFRCGSFGLGIGFPDRDELVIITGNSADKAGVSLGLLEGRVLTEREKELRTVLSPGATPTMALFDFTSLHHRNGKRVPVVLRYAALVDPSNGQVDTVYSLLESTPEGYQFVGDSATLLPRNHTMDWEMHVDGSKVRFGAPKADALAVIKLPQGSAIAVPAEFKAAVVVRSFTAESAAQFERRVREVLPHR